eukprot:3933392-Prymnesium_polylepis.2
MRRDRERVRRRRAALAGAGRLQLAAGVGRRALDVREPHRAHELIAHKLQLVLHRHLVARPNHVGDGSILEAVAHSRVQQLLEAATSVLRHAGAAERDGATHARAADQVEHCADRPPARLFERAQHQQQVEALDTSAVEGQHTDRLVAERRRRLLGRHATARAARALE